MGAVSAATAIEAPAMVNGADAQDAAVASAPGFRV